MNWTDLIAKLIADIYPALVEAFKRWLDKLVQKAKNNYEEQGKYRGTRKELLEECLRIAPKRNVIRVAMLRKLISVEGKLTAADIKELNALSKLDTL